MTEPCTSHKYESETARNLGGTHFGVGEIIGPVEEDISWRAIFQPVLAIEYVNAFLGVFNG